MADHRTGPGERDSFAPIDGVQVEMNSRSSISRGDGTGIALIGGEAVITVATGRTFTVTAGEMLIDAGQATFNVATFDGDVRAIWISGRVVCSLGSRRIALQENEELAVDRSGTATRSRINTATATAWRRGLLIFEDTPLAEVVSQINRYRPGRIVLMDQKRTLTNAPCSRLARSEVPVRTVQYRHEFCRHNSLSSVIGRSRTRLPVAL